MFQSQDLSLALTQKMAVAMKMAVYLEAPPVDFWKMVRELEEDPLFKKLHSPARSEHRAIKIIPRRRFISLDTARAAALPDSDIEEILSGKEEILEKLKKIGKEKFISFFLEEGVTEAEIKELTGLSSRQIKGFRKEVVDRIVIKDIFSDVPQKLEKEISTREVVAEIKVSDDKIAIDYAYEKKRYEIDEGRIEELYKEGYISRKEMEKFFSLIKKFHWINLRFDLVRSVVDEIVRVQRKYILSGNSLDLASFEGKDIAGNLGIDPSWLSRVIKDRFLKIEKKEFPLRNFLLTKRELAKIHGKLFLKDILDNFKAPGRLTDEKICRILDEKYNLKIARRTVNQWRSEL